MEHVIGGVYHKMRYETRKCWFVYHLYFTQFAPGKSAFRVTVQCWLKASIVTPKETLKDFGKPGNRKHIHKGDDSFWLPSSSKLLGKCCIKAAILCFYCINLNIFILWSGQEQCQNPRSMVFFTSKREYVVGVDLGFLATSSTFDTSCSGVIAHGQNLDLLRMFGWFSVGSLLGYLFHSTKVYLLAKLLCKCLKDNLF